MKLQFTLFEDHCLENFHPLTLTRPVYDLRVGIYTLEEKWKRALNLTKEMTGLTRANLKGVFPENEIVQNPEFFLWVNPRFLPKRSLINQINNLNKNVAIQHKDSLIAAKIKPHTHNEWKINGIDLTNLETIAPSANDVIEIRNLWDLFLQNGSEISSDLQRIHRKFRQQNYDGVHFINPDQVHIEEGAVIEPGVVLIAEKGPIYIGKNAHIMANSVVRGPSAICEQSVLKVGSKIYEDTTIGPVCKIGGEVANSIFHSYSNKAHDGFVGNSLFGQWVNLGADTNTSNLKNNYSTVKISNWNDESETDSHQQFLGTIMGDHSKTAINTMLNTGTVCGVSCNLFSEGFPPKLIPSFSWVANNQIETYRFDKSIEAMKKMMERRSIELTPAYKKMMETLFESGLTPY